MNQLLKSRYGGNNTYRSGFEEIQKRIDEWRRLIVAHESALATKVVGADRYLVDIAKLKENYLFLLRVSFIASKGDCTDVPIHNTFLIQSDDLNNNLDDPNLVSNFEWREVNYRLAGDSIIAYTDPTFSITSADLDYLRYPKALDISGYTKFDGSASVDQDCELPDFLHEEIVNEAISIFKLRMLSPDAETSMAATRMEE